MMTIMACVYVYACLYVCIFVHVYGFVRMRNYFNGCASAHVWMCVRVYVCS